MTAQRWQLGVGTVVPRRRIRTATVISAIAILVSVAAIGLTLALFTAQSEADALFGAKAIFPGERVTPAFQVGDRSSGVEIDRSNTFAYGADSLVSTTSAWSTAFAADRYLEFDVNASLASGVAITAATFDIRFASTGAGQACYYFEVRRISTGAVLGTHGSSGSPVGCVTGTTPASFSTPIPAVASTSIANDLRIRLFGQESANASMVVDLATVSGSTVHQAFTLYPVMFRDAADTTPQVIPWGLQIP
jgi:hypothetical protein